MTVVHVAIPILRGRRRFKVEKGRRWSVIEHLMLDAVAEQPASAGELERKSKLPRRIVVEAFIRLMRVGWVELTPGLHEPIFRATNAGLIQADSEQMQATTVIQNRWMAFSFDQVAGSVFRGREMPARRGKVQAPPGETMVFLERSERYTKEDLGEIFAALENEDEIILGTDPLPEPLTPGHAVVTVRDGVIENLSGRARDELKNEILAAAAKAGASVSAEVTPVQIAAEPATVARRSIDALFDHGDLVLDGSEHKRILEETVGRADKTVLLHSTFLTPNGWQATLGTLLSAAARGVKVQIFWGQNDDVSGTSPSRQESDALRAAIAAHGRAADIIVHPFTTGSHAKLLIADDRTGAWSATVGSCNWLSADFESFDASVRLRDPSLIGELVRHLAALSAEGTEGIWTSVSGDLTVLGRKIAAMSRPAGRTAKVRVLLASDHADILLDARDDAKKRMLVASHRIGIGGKPMTIAPAVSAAKEKGISVNLYYGRSTGRLSGHGAAELSLELRQKGVDIRPVHRPRLHAKVLAWDDDDLAVTSLNWLSADPSETALRSEIGIAIQMNKLADNFIRRFEQAKSVS